MLLRPNCNQILKSKNAVIFVVFVETTQKKSHAPYSSHSSQIIIVDMVVQDSMEIPLKN